MMWKLTLLILPGVNLPFPCVFQGMETWWLFWGVLAGEDLTPLMPSVPPLVTSLLFTGKFSTGGDCQPPLYFKTQSFPSSSTGLKPGKLATYPCTVLGSLPFLSFEAPEGVCGVTFKPSCQPSESASCLTADKSGVSKVFAGLSVQPFPLSSLPAMVRLQVKL